MKPLRPHNSYGGTTCPGRATGQVPTIRGLIPKEDDVCKSEAEFNTRWDARWAGKVADVPDGVAEPTGHLNRYLRGTYPRLQNNVAVAATKGGVLKGLAAQVGIILALKNPCNWGADKGTMGERMTQHRNAIEALEQDVSRLKTELAAMTAAAGIQEGETVAIIRRPQ